VPRRRVKSLSPHLAGVFFFRNFVFQCIGLVFCFVLS
jgi:hypothetical protein